MSSTSSVSTSSSVSTGNAQDVSGVSGSKYSLDLATAVTSKVQPYLDRADAIATQINTNQTKIASYQNMQTLLQALQTAASNLTSEATDGSNVFNTRTASMTSTSTVSGGSPSDASVLMSATVASGTVTGTHTVIVNSLAASEVDVSTTQSHASTDALGWAGSFQIAESGKTGTMPSITVTATMSLADIASAINTVTSQTGVTASVVSVSSTSSVLVISGADVDKALTFTAGSGDNVLSNLGILDSTNTLVAAQQVSAAKPANLTVDGVSNITRSSNTVTDVLSGVTLDLTAADPNTQVTLKVVPDTSGTATAIQNFVTAYNSWESFVTTNEATTSSGTASSSAVLFGDSTLRETSLKVDGIITQMINSMSLSDIGVSLNASNQLQVDSTTLTENLKDNFSAVRSLFQSQATSSNYALQSYGTNYSSYSGTFKLTVQTDGSGTVTGVLLNGNPTTAFTVSGNIISGAANSVYSGMSFSFSGTAASTDVTVSSTQGLANQLYTVSKGYGNTLNGTVQNMITKLQDQDTSMTSEYNSIISQANDYTDYLVKQYATYTTKIESASYSSTVLSEMFAMQTSG